MTTHEDEQTIYRCLDVLDKYSKQIQNRMNTKIKNSSIGRVTNLTYYDVTNYYFEIDEPDELRLCMVMMMFMSLMKTMK